MEKGLVRSNLHPSYNGVLLFSTGIIVGFFSVLLSNEFWFATDDPSKSILWGWLLIGIGFLPFSLKVLSPITEKGAHRRKIDMFAPDVAFLLAYSVIYGSGVFRSALIYELALDDRIIRYILEGIVAFLGGLLMSKVVIDRASVPKLANQTYWRVYRWRTSRLFHMILIMFVSSLCIFVFSISRTGWLLAQSDLEMVRTQVIGQIGGYAFYMIRSMAIVLYLGFVFLFRNRLRQQKVRGAVFLLLVIGTLVLLGTGYRNGIAVSIIAGLVIYNYMVRGLGLKDISIVVLALLLGMAGYALWRGGQSAIGPHLLVDRAWHEIALPFFTMRTTIDSVPQIVPHLRGRGILMTFVALLPGEQPVLGSWLKEQLGLKYVGGGFGPSILGGLFLEFGESGILLGMFTVGVILQAVYMWMRRKRSDYSVIVYSLLLTYSVQAIRDGLLKDFFPIWSLLLITLVHLAITKMPSVAFRHPNRSP